MKKKRTKLGTSRKEAAARRAKFIEEYLSNGQNARRAAIAAGFSPAAADQQASRAMARPDVKAEIARRQAELFASATLKSELKALEIIESLARDIRFDPAKLYNEDGSLKRISELDEDTRLALRGVEVDEIKAGGDVIGRTAKVKFPEKTAAREQGMKHFGLYKMDNEQKPQSLALPPGTKSITLDFSKIRERAKAAAKGAA